MHWRDVGDTTEAVVRAELARRASPLLPESTAIWRAMSGSGFGRLVLAILANEQQYGVDTSVIPAALRNPMSLKREDGSGRWAEYASYTDGVRDGVRRLRATTGPYAATTTLDDLARVYAPASDGNDPGEVARFWERYILRYRGLEGPAGLDWTPVPYPPMVDLVVPKPYEGAGFDRVRPRRERIVGVCDHITAGEGSVEFYAAFFGTGGERATDALVDTVIGRDGRIGVLNDWRDPARGGTRAGWANGGSNGLEGRGVAFVQALGPAAINERLVSKEHVAREGQPPTDAQMAASIALDVAILHERRVPWYEYPFSSALGGLAVDYDHADFATKPCPGEPWRSTYGPIKEREVRAGLARAQTGQPDPSPPDPIPSDPGQSVPMPPSPLGQVGADAVAWDETVLAALFGTLTRHLPGGATRLYPFDPTGPISTAWLARCRRELLFPEADAWWTVGATHLVRFANGWLLATPVLNDRAAWRWIEEAPVAGPLAEGGPAASAGSSMGAPQGEAGWPIPAAWTTQEGGATP